MLCALADGIDALRAQGVAVERLFLIGGGAQSAAVRAIAPSVLGLDVRVPTPGEYVADGAARQAAWVLSGAATPPSWSAAGEATVFTGRPGAAGARAVRGRPRAHGRAPGLTPDRREPGTGVPGSRRVRAVVSAPRRTRP